MTAYYRYQWLVAADRLVTLIQIGALIPLILSTRDLFGSWSGIIGVVAAAIVLAMTLLHVRIRAARNDARRPMLEECNHGQLHISGSRDEFPPSRGRRRRRR